MSHGITWQHCIDDIPIVGFCEKTLDWRCLTDMNQVNLPGFSRYFGILQTDDLSEIPLRA